MTSPIPRRINLGNPHFAAGQVCIVLLFLMLPRLGHSQEITEVAEVKNLRFEEAEEGRSVRLRGVITCFDGKNFGFFQDGSGGTYFNPQEKAASFVFPELPHGTLVELTGKTVRGKFAPYVGAEIRVRVLGKGPLPKPLRPEKGRLLHPKYHSQWIEVTAHVESAIKIKYPNNPLTLELELIYGGRRFKGYLGGDWKNDPIPENLVNSDIRARGVFGSTFDRDNELAGMRLFIPSIEEVEFIDQGMEKAFSLSPRKSFEIMQFNRGRDQRVKFEGTLLAAAAEGIFLRDDDGAIRVKTFQKGDWEIGRKVEVVGYPVSENGESLLEDAVLRVGDRGPSPQAITATILEMERNDLHGNLVTVHGRVADVLKWTKDSALLLDTPDGQLFAKMVAGLSEVEIGSLVAVTGICLKNQDWEANKFRLLVREPADIRILKSPPWWTIGRIAAVLGAVVCILAISLAWAITLRRRVKMQTTIISKKLEKEKITEERNRIARELHDTIEQELVGVTVQLDTVASRLRDSPDRAEETLGRARAMLRHTQSEARRSVWDLRAEALARGDLGTALRDLISTLSEQATIPIDFQLEGDPFSLSGPIENHLYRITQEAVQNSLKHSNARSISASLRYEGDHLDLNITDDGSGFNPDTAANFQTGHFGLQGMRERAGKIGGVLKIRSEAGAGTEIQFRITKRKNEK